MIKNMQTYGKFRFGVINDKMVLKDTFKMRYEVYVEEFGFEKQEDHPDQLETDNWEDESIHMACLNENDAVVGTIRLVLNSPKGFPIESSTELTFIGDKPPKNQIAEISRLTVSKDLRRRKEDGFYGIESYMKKKDGGVLPDDGSIPPEMKGRKNPVLLLGLCQAMYQESKRQGITHWYMITEEKLFKALYEFNFIFHPIGKKIWYHGWRTPYLGFIDEIDRSLAKKSPSMLKFLLTGLEKEYHPSFFDIENFS